MFTYQFLGDVKRTTKIQYSSHKFILVGINLLQCKLNNIKKDLVQDSVGQISVFMLLANASILKKRCITFFLHCQLIIVTKYSSIPQHKSFVRSSRAFILTAALKLLGRHSNFNEIRCKDLTDITPKAHGQETCSIIGNYISSSSAAFCCCLHL